MTEETAIQHILIGTAGHIDHGKTRLVGKLTNINTDRLPEERARGISIDLGFAHWESDGIQFGVVDVPGHERFVKNMVAGATGVDLALLVVAADDGVMPQTREHLEIMDLLGLKTGLIAITKIDIVDPDFVELVESEIEDVISHTFLGGCPIIPVSSETGDGIDQLRQTLVQVAKAADTQKTHNLFRMPVDRVFSITGHGSVVTGSVQSGEVAAGDIVELLPQQREVRVRSVQNHGLNTDDSGARQRTAVNLAGVKTGEVARGMELATLGFLQPTSRIVVEVRNLSSSPVELKDRLELNLHLGTTEVMARMNLKRLTLKAGEQGIAELRTEEPVVVTYGQRFILRRISPQMTVAGGRVLDPAVEPQKRIKDLQSYGAALGNPSPLERLSTVLAIQDSVKRDSVEAVARAAIRPDEYDGLFDKLTADGVLVSVGTKERPIIIHRDRLASVEKAVMRIIQDQLDRHQPRRSLPRNTLNTACRAIAQGALLDAVFSHLLKQKELVQVGNNLGPANAQVKLTKQQKRNREHILESIDQGQLAPPTAKELGKQLSQEVANIETLLNLCEEDGLLVRVGPGMFYSPAALEQARTICAATLEDVSEATLSQLREAWGVSRKFAVPMCEYFDQLRVTIRKDDVRIPGPNIGTPLNAE